MNYNIAVTVNNHNIKKNHSIILQTVTFKFNTMMTFQDKKSEQ